MAPATWHRATWSRRGLSANASLPSARVSNPEPIRAPTPLRALCQSRGCTSWKPSPKSECLRLAVQAPGATVALRAGQTTRLMVIGGDALDGHRFMWWNFVSSRKERIVQASRDWEAQNMGRVPRDTELIPLPARRSTAD
ncbi:MAG: hypothetical protein H0W47_08530 [Polaromonas sp.]|nr:hypothetical protein [Polaromonas sp.]